MARHVRGSRALALEAAVHKMTALAAQHMGMQDRGVLRPGAFADLVLFDPKTVADRATAEDPTLPSVGILGVWVNGRRVFSEDGPTGERPGKVIRRAED